LLYCACVLAAPALAICGKPIWQRALFNWETVLFVCFLGSVSIFRFDAVKLLTPILGIALALMELYRLKYDRNRAKPDLVLASSAA
jgi:hypothetical protein